LNLRLVGNIVELTWSTNAAGFLLQANFSLSNPNWQPAAYPVISSNGCLQVQVKLQNSD